MQLSNHHRSIARGLLGAAVIIAAACSGSDRADAGRDTTRATMNPAPVDTQPTAVGAVPSPDTDTAAAASTTQTADTAVESRDQAVSGYQAMREPASVADTTSRDTSSAEIAGAADTGTAPADTEMARADTVALSDSVTVGDSAQIGKAGERLDSSVATGQATVDTVTSQIESDRVRPPEDSSETLGAMTGEDTGTVSDQADTSATAARADTSTAQADTIIVGMQADTMEPAEMDTSAQAPTDTGTIQVAADTTTAGQQPEVAGDTAAADQQIAVTADTATTDQQSEVAVDTQTDTMALVGDSAQVGKTGERLEANAPSAEANADSLAAEAERVRPPEDSTEVLGNVTNQEQKAEAEPGDANADTAPVAAAGVQTTGNIATGADAVSLLSREGQPCTVVTGDESQDAQWDLASSPATMNPCGTGTMTLPRIQTGEK
jgi:hypothetical protein